MVSVDRTEDGMDSQAITTESTKDGALATTFVSQVDERYVFLGLTERDDDGDLSEDRQAAMSLTPTEARALANALQAMAARVDYDAYRTRFTLTDGRDPARRNIARANAEHEAREAAERASMCAHAYLEADATCSVCGAVMADLEAAHEARVLEAAREADRLGRGAREQRHYDDTYGDDGASRERPDGE